MKTQPVDAQELEKAKNQIISNFILGRDSDQERADALGRYTVLGKDPGLINTELERYLKVNAADIRRVAREYFVPLGRTVLVVEPPKATENK